MPVNGLVSTLIMRHFIKLVLALKSVTFKSGSIGDRSVFMSGELAKFGGGSSHFKDDERVGHVTFRK